MIPNLTDYAVSPLALDAPKLPVGYDLGRTRFDLLPDYKTGIAVQAGTEASVVIRGELRNVDGSPATFLAGQVVHVDESGGPSATLFTNGAGRFFVEGLSPGRYEIRTYGGDWEIIALEIGDDVEGVHDLSVVTLAAAILAPSSVWTLDAP